MKGMRPAARPVETHVLTREAPLNRTRRWTTAICALIVATATPVGAQESLNLSVLNQGKAPPGPVQVSAVVEGEKVALATTSSTGTASLDFDLLNLGKGTPVGVHLVNCDGETEIILLPPGEVSDECDRAREDPNCSCRRLGVIAWGETSTATVRLENGGSLNVPDPPEQVGMDIDRYRELLRIGVGATYSTFSNLEDTGCFGAAGCEVDDSALGGKVFLEWDPIDRLPLYVGLQGGYTSVSVDQVLSGGGTNEVDLDIYSAGLYGGVRLPLSTGIGARFHFGPRYLWNRGNITTTFGTDVETESRSDDGLRFSAGAGLDFVPRSRSFGLRLGYTYTNGDEDDADQNHALGLAAFLLFGGGQ